MPAGPCSPTRSPPTRGSRPSTSGWPWHCYISHARGTRAHPATTRSGTGPAGFPRDSPALAPASGGARLHPPGGGRADRRQPYRPGAPSAVEDRGCAPLASGPPVTGAWPLGHRRDKENVVVEEKNSKIETDPVLRSRPDQSTQAPTITTPDTQAHHGGAAIGQLYPFDLRAIGQPAGSPPTTVPPPAHRHRRPRLGLTLEELASVAGDDPILAAELARRTAPPAPAEPPPATIPTVELFELLPGRHDLIMIAARRLCEETNDFKPASQRTFEKMARRWPRGRCRRRS